MTRAPANLLAVRTLLLTHLRPHGLEPAEVGIVGDARHVGEGDSYHLGSPEQDPRGSYSVMESPRDRALTEYACAIDVGTFRATTPTGTYDLPHYSRWLVAQCVAGTPDTRDIREVIYSPDGKVVKRWDRLGRRTSGDGSHLLHTHKSFHRDAIKAGRDQTAVVRRYLTTIGLLEEPDMPITDAEMDDIAQRSARAVHDQRIGKSTVTIGQLLQSLPGVIATEGTSPAELTAALGALPQPTPVNVDGLAAALTERLKAALPAGTPVTDEQLERVLRSALGSLDNAPQG